MRQSHIYLAIKECKEEYGDPVEVSCEILGVSRAAYYRWLSGKKCDRELENEKIAELMEQIHTENPDKGYRRIKDDLAHDHKLNVNEKRVLRICRSLDILLLFVAILPPPSFSYCHRFSKIPVFLQRCNVLNPTLDEYYDRLLFSPLALPGGYFWRYIPEEQHQ